MAGYGALKSAALNVYINTGTLKDRGFADAKLQDLEALISDSEAEAEQVYQIVKEKL